METILASLVVYALGVSQNASWDAIKLIVGRIFRQSAIDIQQLYVDAFVKAIELRLPLTDEQTQLYLIKLRKAIVLDRRLLIDSLVAISYQDYGIFLSSLETQEFQHNLASELLARCKPDNGDFDRYSDALQNVITDFLGYYRLQLVQKLSAEESQRLMLLQTLKIDGIKASIEELRQEIASRSILIPLQPEVRGELTQQLGQYEMLLAREYDSHRAVIEVSNVEADREIMLKDLQRILSAKGFRPVAIAEPEVDLVAETKGVFSTRVAVRGDGHSKPSSIKQVMAFKRHYPRTSATYGYFISQAGFTSEALAQGDRTLKLYSYQEFTNELVDFAEYIEQIVSDYESSPLFRDYEPVLGGEDRSGEGADLVDKIDGLFSSGDTNKVAVLANFGMGKTTLGKRLVYVLAKRYQQHPIGNRIPVFVPLSQHDRAAGINATIAYALQQQGVDINPQLCVELQKMGRFVFVFDGFDEMSLHPDKVSIQQNLRELEKVSQIGANKLVLTSRTHFFRDEIDQARLVGYRFLFIHEWGKRQLESYLRKRLGAEWAAARDRIVDSAALWELAKTPLFLEMMAVTVPDMARSDLTPTELFEAFTDRWIDQQDYRSYMLTGEKRKFMSDLACLLFFNDRFAVHYTDLRDVVRRTFNLQIIEDVDYFDNDTRTCSFLVRDSRGNYRFSHRSFMEFFVARTLASEVSEIIKSMEGNEELERYNFPKRKLSNEIYMFLSQMHIDVEHLLRLIRATRDLSFESVKYLGSNAITILKYMKFDLSRSDLSGCVLVDADFAGMNLTATNFSGANLYTANFNNCTLDHADMTNTNLRYCSIKGLNGIFDFIVDVYDDVSVVGTMLRSLFLLDVNERIIDKIDGHSDGIWALSQLTGTTKVATGGRDHTVQLWDLPSHELVRSFDGHFDNVWRIVSDPSGRHLASCSSDRLIKIWSPDRVDPELVLSGHADEVRDIAFIDNNVLVSCGLDRVLRVWNLHDGTWREYAVDEDLLSLAVSHDGKFVLLGNAVGWITVLTFPDLRVVQNFRVHDGGVRSLACSPQEYRFASGGGDGRMISGLINNLQDAEEIARHDGFVNRVRFTRDGEQIYSVGYDSRVYFQSFGTGELRMVDLGETLYGAGNRFSCTGLILKGSSGLSSERLQDLQRRGAVLG